MQMINTARCCKDRMAMASIGVLGAVWISFLAHPFPYKAIGCGIWLVLLYGARMDVKTHRIHDGVWLSVAVLGAVYAGATFQPLSHWGAGLALNGLVMGLLYLLSCKSIGMGDVRLVTALGIFLGPLKSFYLLFHASWLGALVAVTGLVLKKMNRNHEIPFVPFIAAGYLLAISSL